MNHQREFTTSIGHLVVAAVVRYQKKQPMSPCPEVFARGRQMLRLLQWRIVLRDDAAAQRTRWIARSTSAFVATALVWLGSGEADMLDKSHAM